MCVVSVLGVSSYNASYNALQCDQIVFELWIGNQLLAGNQQAFTVTTSEVKMATHPFKDHCTHKLFSKDHCSSILQHKYTGICDFTDP